MATIKDVAREAGVGVGTVSRALSNNGSVHPETKRRIDEIAAKLGFVPNQQARNLKKRSSGCLALIVPTIFHPFFAKVALYFENEIHSLGYRMVVVSSQDNRTKEKMMIEMIKQQRVDGIIFVTHYDHDKLDPSLPIVSIDRHLGAGIPYVTSNNYEVSRLVVERLIATGAKNVACICGDPIVESETTYRYKAYIDVMNEHGLPIRLLKKPIEHGQELEIMREFFRLFPEADGIFAGSDMLAIVAYYLAIQMGKKVPEELQIIGFDGVLDVWVLQPRLTVVQQNIPEMAKAAVGLLMKRIRGEETPAKIEIPASIIEGETAK